MHFSRSLLPYIGILLPIYIYLFCSQLAAKEQTILANDEPYLLMQRTIKQTLTRLKQEQAQIIKDPRHLKLVVHQELMPYIDVQYVSALMLGPYFNDLNKEQKQQYFQIIAQFLEKNYAQLLNSYKDQRYQIVKPSSQINPLCSIVRLLVDKKNSSQAIKIDFKWHKNPTNASWKIYDILLEGVSVVRSRQQQWGSMLYKNGFNYFINKLKDKVK